MVPLLYPLDMKVAANFHDTSMTNRSTGIYHRMWLGFFNGQYVTLGPIEVL
jgi:hypothetical protein